MSPGPVEEAGQTARTFMDIMRGQPLVLALCIMNLALLGLIYWERTAAEHERTEGLRLLYENRKYVGDLLAHCYPENPNPPPPVTRP